MTGSEADPSIAQAHFYIQCPLTFLATLHVNVVNMREKVSWLATFSDEGCIPLIRSPGSAPAHVMTISQLKYTKLDCRQERPFGLLDLGPLLLVSRESETELQIRI